MKYGQDNLNLSILDYYILSIFHYLVSPLSFSTLIFDLIRTNHPRTSVTAFNGQASSDEFPTNDSHRTTGKTIILGISNDLALAIPIDLMNWLCKFYTENEKE